MVGFDGSVSVLHTMSGSSTMIAVPYSWEDEVDMEENCKRFAPFTDLFNKCIAPFIPKLSMEEKFEKVMRERILRQKKAMQEQKKRQHNERMLQLQQRQALLKLQKKQENYDHVPADFYPEYDYDEEWYQKDLDRKNMDMDCEM